MEENDSGKHTHHVTQAHHRIGHAEGEMLDDIHPQDGACAIAETTADELPVGKQSDEILPGEREVTSPRQTVLHQHLPPSKKHALQK